MEICRGNVSIGVHLTCRYEKKKKVAGYFIRCFYVWWNGDYLSELIRREKNKIDLFAIKESSIQQKWCDKTLRNLFMFLRQFPQGKLWENTLLLFFFPQVKTFLLRYLALLKIYWSLMDYSDVLNAPESNFPNMPFLMLDIAKIFWVNLKFLGHSNVA